MSSRVHLQSLVLCGLLAAVAPARAAALPANCNCDLIRTTDHHYIVEEEAELPDLPYAAADSSPGAITGAFASALIAQGIRLPK